MFDKVNYSLKKSQLNVKEADDGMKDKKLLLKLKERTKTVDKFMIEKVQTVPFYSASTLLLLPTSYFFLTLSEIMFPFILFKKQTPRSANFIG